MNYSIDYKFRTFLFFVDMNPAGHHHQAPPPRLTESNVTSYIENVLYSCHNVRIQVYSFIFNSIVLILFVSLFGISLWICRVNKLSPEEKSERFIRDQQHILAKIRFHESADHRNEWIDQYLP